MPCELGHEGRCRPGPRADFGSVAWELKKNPIPLFEII
jgi:hypothetical protein